MTKKMTDTQILRAIHKLVDVDEWTPETLENIAELLHGNGYKVRWMEEVLANLAYHRSLRNSRSEDKA